MLWVSVTATAAALTCFCPILVSKVTECGAEWRRRHIHHIQPAISQPATQIGKCKNVKFSAQADYSASSCGGLVNTPSLHVPAPGCRTAQLLNIHFLLRLTGLVTGGLERRMINPGAELWRSNQRENRSEVCRKLEVREIKEAVNTVS